MCRVREGASMRYSIGLRAMREMGATGDNLFLEEFK